MNVKKKMMKQIKTLKQSKINASKVKLLKIRLEQNEDLAKLRAGVSLAKSGVQQAQVMIGR